MFIFFGDILGSIQQHQSTEMLLSR